MGALLDAHFLVPAAAPEVVKALIDLLAGFEEGLDDDVAILAVGIPSRS